MEEGAPEWFPAFSKITQIRVDPNHSRSWCRQRGRVSRPTPPDDRVIARRRQVGEHIRHVREEHDLSQREVCERTGIDVATYSRIEQGHSSPLLDTLIRISDAIGVPLAELVGGAAAPDGGGEGGRARPATGGIGEGRQRGV